jgi:protein CWC15
VYRQPGQGGDADTEIRDLRAELLAAEGAHFAKTKGQSNTVLAPSISSAPKRQIEGDPGEDRDGEEDPEAKRRRILQETRDIDADSDGSDSDSSDEER